MTIKRKAAGAWVDIATTIKRRASGAWEQVNVIKRRSAGAWVTIWSSVKLSGVSVSDYNTGSATAGIQLTSSGNENERTTSGYSLLAPWLIVGASSGYEARCTVTATNGNGTNIGTFATWQALSSNREWRISETIGVATRTVTIEIRSAATLAVIISKSYDWTADPT